MIAWLSTSNVISDTSVWSQSSVITIQINTTKTTTNIGDDDTAPLRWNQNAIVGDNKN